MVEKQASSEIAQSRFEKWFHTTEFSFAGPIGTYKEVARSAWVEAERDTRERVAQIAKTQIINWSNNLCDESRAEVTTVKLYSADPIKFGGEAKKYAAECLASCAMAVAERIGGKE